MKIVFKKEHEYLSGVVAYKVCFKTDYTYYKNQVISQGVIYLNNSALTSSKFVKLLEDVVPNVKTLFTDFNRFDADAEEFKKVSEKVKELSSLVKRDNKVRYKVGLGKLIPELTLSDMGIYQCPVYVENGEGYFESNCLGMGFLDNSKTAIVAGLERVSGGKQAQMMAEEIVKSVIDKNYDKPLKEISAKLYEENKKKFSFQA